MAKILVVDDEAQVRSLMQKVLSASGHTVMEATNGVEALATYKASGADLVITDILMPEKGGLSLLTDIRRANPSQPILAISGGGKDGKMDFLSTASTVPGVKTLHKPFSLEEFSEMVDELLKTGHA